MCAGSTPFLLLVSFTVARAVHVPYMWGKEERAECVPTHMTDALRDQGDSILVVYAV